jgi:hypothetical protein
MSHSFKTLRWHLLIVPGIAGEVMMTRLMRFILIAGLTASLTGAAPAAEQALPGWMAGAWHEEKAGQWTEEFWFQPRAGQMLGTSRSGRGEKPGSWEVMRITVDPKSGLALLASPEGGTPTRFERMSSSANEIMFANEAHDYPQKIRYRREGPRLIAEISMMDGSKAMRWTYERGGA